MPNELKYPVPFCHIEYKTRIYDKFKLEINYKEIKPNNKTTLLNHIGESNILFAKVGYYF